MNHIEKLMSYSSISKCCMMKALYLNFVKLLFEVITHRFVDLGYCVFNEFMCCKIH